MTPNKIAKVLLNGIFIVEGCSNLKDMELSINHTLDFVKKIKDSLPMRTYKGQEIDETKREFWIEVENQIKEVKKL